MEFCYFWEASVCSVTKSIFRVPWNSKAEPCSLEPTTGPILTLIWKEIPKADVKLTLHSGKHAQQPMVLK